VRQLLQTVIQQWVEIAEQYKRNLGLPAYLTAESQNLVQGDAAVQRPFRCTLNDRAVCDRVGKRHAQLNDIGARFFQRED
jgi:hypothetical protein